MREVGGRLAFGLEERLDPPGQLPEDAGDARHLGRVGYVGAGVEVAGREPPRQRLDLPDRRQGAAGQHVRQGGRPADEDDAEPGQHRPRGHHAPAQRRVGDERVDEPGARGGDHRHHHDLAVRHGVAAGAGRRLDLLGEAGGGRRPEDAAVGQHHPERTRQARRGRVDQRFGASAVVLQGYRRRQRPGRELRRPQRPVGGELPDQQPQRQHERQRHERGRRGDQRVEAASHGASVGAASRTPTPRTVCR